MNFLADTCGTINELGTLSRILQQMAGVTIKGVAIKRPPGSGVVSIRGIKLYVHDIIDDRTEYDRISKSLAILHERIMGKLAKVNNRGFRAHAKPEIVTLEQNRLHDLLSEQQSLLEYQEELNCVGED